METVIRVTIMYLVVTFGLRIVGKRAFGQLAPADLVVLMMIPDIFQQAVIREDFSMLTAVVAVCSLLLLTVITDTLTYRLPALGKLVNGSPITVAAHGELRTDRMNLERLAPDEILDAMHRAGLERIDEVKWAVLYPDGSIAVVPWSRPLATPQQRAAHPVS